MSEFHFDSPGEHKEGQLKGRGAGIIFYIRSSDKFMFFLRDDKPTIPFPNMIDIIGGHIEDADKTPIDAALREVAEELFNYDTNLPFQPEGVRPFVSYVDGRSVEQNIFSCELETLPRLRLDEGQSLILLSRDEIKNTEFAFGYDDVIQKYVESVTSVQ